jgi:pyrroline-5-carboxylate reductase
MGSNGVTDLLLVGCGRMGSALVQGWLAGKAADHIWAVEPADVALADPRLHHVRDAAGLPADLAPEVVVLAVKPQMMPEALPAYRRFAGPGTLFLSIAAGRTLAYLEQGLGPEAAVVRAMPNTPAAIGQGISVLVANPLATPAQRQRAEALMQAAGQTAWIDDDALMDAVTAVSGSGPAYVFHLIETLAAAGHAAGLPADLAMRLARQTVVGSGALAGAASESPAELRIAVTSPKGTTQAALDVLMAPDGLQPLMTRAVAAAARRGRELA